MAPKVFKKSLPSKKSSKHGITHTFQPFHMFILNKSGAKNGMLLILKTIFCSDGYDSAEINKGRIGDMSVQGTEEFTNMG